MLQTECVVIDIVGWRNFQTPRTELDINILVFYNGNLSAHQWHNDVLAFEPRILRIVGIDTHSSVAHNGFRACRCHNSIVFRIFNHPIFQIIELRMFVFINHLFIRKCRLSLRIPVYHSHAAINQSFVVEIAKNLNHTLGARFVHCESRTIPVARSSKLTKLLQYDAAVFVCPIPRVTQKLVAHKVGLLNTLLCELVYDFCFCGYRSVICTRNPTRILSFHSCTTY